MTFDFSLQTLLQGLLVGGVYGLIGLGLSLIFGVMRVVNFAHGDALTLGMFLALFLATRFHIDPYLGILAALPLGFALGYAIERLILARLPQGLGNASLLATLGLGLIFSNSLFLGFGAQPQSVNVPYAIATVNFAGARLSIPFVVAGAVTLVAILALNALLYRTELGRAIRATAQNSLGAELQGVDTGRVRAIVFGIGVALALLAGILLLPILGSVIPTIGENFLLKAFVVTVLGGLGNLSGAVLGGLFLGLIETIGATGTIGSVGLNAWRDAFGLVLFLLVLLFRPEGLFGKTVTRV